MKQQSPINFNYRITIIVGATYLFVHSQSTASSSPPSSSSVSRLTVIITITLIVSATTVKYYDNIYIYIVKIKNTLLFC